MTDHPAKERAFEQILDANKRRLGGIARSYATGDQWHDLYQEMLMQIWRSIDSFEGRSAVDTWVYRIALNTAMTYRRRASTQVETTVSGRDPVAHGTGQSEISVLQDFIASLGPVDRAVFLLYLEDLTYAQMSEVLGMSENAVGVRINRLKKAFMARYL